MKRWTNALVAIVPRIRIQEGISIQKIQRHRNIATMGVIGSVFVLVCEAMLWFFGFQRAHPWLAFLVMLLPMAAANRAVIISLVYLTDLCQAFFDHRLKEYSLRLEREIGIGVHPRFCSFLFHPDLALLERNLLNLLRTEIKRVRAEKRKERSRADQKVLEEAHTTLDEEILLASEGILGADKVKKILSSSKALREKRSFLADLSRFVVMGPRGIADRPQNKIEKMTDVLTTIAEQGLDPDAEAKLEQSVRATHDEDRERFLREAIRLQQSHNRNLRTKAKHHPQQPQHTAAFETQYVRLWDVARKRFRSLRDLFPDAVDHDMAEAILLVLIDPGRKVNIFEANYRPEDALRKEVVRYYSRFDLRFTGSTFDDTLKWLSHEGVLFSKPKTDERVYSLSAKPSNGKSRLAQELIRRVIVLNRELKS